MQRVTLADLGDMFQQPWLATLATHRKDGSVLLSPVWWEWDGEAFWISIPQDDIKDRHITRDPRVSLSLAEEASFPGRGLEIGAVVEKVPDPGAVGLRRIATRYLGAKVADEWLQQFHDVQWLLLQLKPDRVRAYDHRDEPLLREAMPHWPSGQSSLPSPPGSSGA
jgi:PPOX class probable F420-dependent enzyme